MDNKTRILNALKATVELYPSFIRKSPKPTYYFNDEEKCWGVEYEMKQPWSRSVNLYGYEGFIESFVERFKGQLKKRKVTWSFEYTADSTEINFYTPSAKCPTCGK
jgi:hypothetical protein